MSGVSVEEHLGRGVPEVLPGLEDVESLLRRVLETGEPLVGVLNRGRTPVDPENEHVWEVSYYRLADSRAETLGVSLLVSDVTKRHEAQQAMDAAQFRLALVNEASARIGTSLDLRRTSQELAEVAVPRFADLVLLDLLESVLDVEAPVPEAAPAVAVMRRMAARGGRAELEERLPDPVGSRIVHASDNPAVDALRTGRALLVPYVHPELIDANARSVETAEYAHRVDLRSVVLAPLVARGNVLGVASFARVDGSSPFDEQDRALAEELAARAAVAIDNARLYRRERVTAVAVQRSLLPQSRPRLTGLAVASRYEPGSGSTQVGGDWFDVIPLSEGRVALVVGDVMGRGLRAAAAMGQLRTAVRTLAVLDLTPDDVVAHLDDVAQSLEGVQLATCVYAIYDPVARTATYAAAGHPPPTLLRPGAPVELLEMPSGAPLGVGGVPFDSADVVVPDGSVLVLYTDGLVESRTEDLDAGLLQLRGVLDSAPAGLEELCDAILRGLGRDGAHDDDVALLAARMAGVPQTCTASWSVPADLSAVSFCRHRTAATCAGWGLSALEDIATLLVSEVVTNAIRYAHDPITLRLLLLDDVLVVSVQDSDRRLPRLRRASAEDEWARPAPRRHAGSALGDPLHRRRQGGVVRAGPAEH